MGGHLGGDRFMNERGVDVTIPARPGIGEKPNGERKRRDQTGSVRTYYSRTDFFFLFFFVTPSPKQSVGIEGESAKGAV